MTICTHNARTLASEASVEDLMIQARKIKHDVIGLTVTPHAAYDSGEELFLGTCDSRGLKLLLMFIYLKKAFDSVEAKSATNTLTTMPLKVRGSQSVSWDDAAQWCAAV
ncbi:unnamed protein product [Heligmosomoides polygyrus]|uniref:Integrase n=1 Tax=Heligmosomoides polygyrus TaxID=6339 RepID=A0A183FL54_HELPZ|nr:unnamed protein product [Heligmosomoides polygyrus]